MSLEVCYPPFHDPTFHEIIYRNTININYICSLI